MMKKLFLSRKWLMAGGILFLSVACQPKADPSQHQDSRREQPARSMNMDSGCKDNSCKSSCPEECPKKACPCPAECPKKECKECPCPEKCPKKACPCPPKGGCKSCALEPEKKADVAVSQSDMRKETKAEASSVKTVTETSKL